MKVTKFTYDKPDNDYGTINFDMDGVLENKSDHDVEFVKTSVIILNENDVAVGAQKAKMTEFLSHLKIQEMLAF